MLDAIFSILLETLLVGVFYWPGWLILRVITLGRYPPQAPIPHNEYFVATVGAAIPFTLITIALA